MFIAFISFISFISFIANQILFQDIDDELFEEVDSSTEEDDLFEIESNGEIRAVLNDESLFVLTKLCVYATGNSVSFIITDKNGDINTEKVRVGINDNIYDYLLRNI